MAKIKSNNYELDRLENILTVTFNTGDIVIDSGYMEYSLFTDLSLKYDVKEKQIANGMEKVILKTNYGTTVPYHLYQLFNFREFKEDFDTYVNELINLETNLDITLETESVMDEIMSFHKDNLINSYLDSGNEKAFNDLMNK